MKLYESLVMEIRPRLQSVNVFIVLNGAESNSVKINLNWDHFELVSDLGKETIQCKDFRIIPESLSCLLQEKCFVSFRFQTENLKQDHGSSKFEFIAHNKTFLSSQIDGFIKSNVFYDLTCANCTQFFCQQIKFERVLPLPDNPDPSDWFCHAHEDNSPNLTPKIAEAFFSHTFVHVNEHLLNGLLKTSSNIFCKRCLAWIGTILKSTHKIWFNTVDFSGENIKSSALEDIFKTLRQILSNSLLSSCRIVLNCQSSQSQTDFVLLWVLEKKLKVYFDLGGVDGAYDGDVAKVLFKFDKIRSDLVDQWLKDVNVNTVDISKPMMVSLLEHLYKMNRFIPKDFGISNDFYVSYVMMYKENENK